MSGGQDALWTPSVLLVFISNTVDEETSSGETCGQVRRSSQNNFGLALTLTW
jgi:hypothetical protein